MHVHVADDAALVDHEDCALRIALAAQHTVELCHLAMRVEVAEKRVGDAPQAFRPCPQAVFAVNTETQDLGLDPFEPGQCGLVRWDSTRSDGGPGQRKEGQDNLCLPR